MPLLPRATRANLRVRDIAATSRSRAARSARWRSPPAPALPESAATALRGKPPAVSRATPAPFLRTPAPREDATAKDHRRQTPSALLHPAWSARLGVARPFAL